MKKNKFVIMNRCVCDSGFDNCVIIFASDVIFRYRCNVNNMPMDDFTMNLIFYV